MSLPSRVLVIALFALAVAHVRSELELVGPMTAAFVIVGVLAMLVVEHKKLAAAKFSLLLVAGSVVALALGVFGYGSVMRRSSDDWARVQTREGERIAERATSRFASLCASARDAARQLARASAIAVAVEGSDAQDYSSEAFDALAQFPLPSAHPRGAPGATLYDALRRPLAWSGDNVSLDELLLDTRRVPESQLAIIEHGIYVYLVAIEPLLSRRGFVSVEIPLAADRRLQNRYLEDYDAVSTWLGRRAETEFRFAGAEPSMLSERLPTSDHIVWSGPEEAPRFLLALESDRGELLGVSSVAGESIGIARVEARRRLKLFAAIALVAAAAGAFFIFAFDLRAPLSLTDAALVVTGLWCLRLVAFFCDLPLSFGLDVDNPTDYASSLFFGLARSPIDFLLTAVALMATAYVAARAVAPIELREGANVVFRLIATSLALLLLVGTNEVILDAWLNSSLSLSTMSIFPLDPPRLALQLGLVLLFLASVMASGAILRLGRGRTLLASVPVDAAVVVVALVAARRFGLEDHTVLAIVPLIVSRAVSFRNELFESPRGRAGLYVRFSTAGLVTMSAVASFYPAIARFEDSTIRDFIESTVTPIVRQHGSSRLYAVAETASVIDRMDAEGRLGALDREDLAFRIWGETNLIASSLSSSIEIIDDVSRVVSRFALSLPTPEVDTARAPAPEEWILEYESIDSDPGHPGVVLVRRSIEGPPRDDDDADGDGDEPTSWEIRVRLAADWRNLPFISTSNPYLHLFSTAGVDAPFRYPYRELSLYVFQPDGTAVFQSTGGVLPVDEQVLEEARRTPVWWTYSRGGEVHESYLFNDGTHTFALSYVRTGLLTYAAELAAWAVLAAGVTALALAAALLLGAFGAEGGVSPRELWSGVGTSFHGKLYVAFVLVALVPIGSLAFLIRGVVIEQLDRDIEQEAMARAQIVERFVDDFLRYQRVDTAPRGDSRVTDAVLEWVGSLAGVDVDLYANGELVATSKPELFGSGLLRTRVAPTAYRELVLEQLTHSIHREAVGSFEYLVVSVPIAVAPRQEPGILALPLASEQTKIDVRVSSMNQTLLLTAFCFSLAAAALAYSLARRIAGPINTLTEATHRVADGDLDVALSTGARDEIGALFASFTQMAADLKRQRSDLERTKKLEAWAEMARQVAHEVKNPLTPIQLAAEHLLRVHDDPDIDFEKVLDECTETILQQVKSLRQISMEFSTFASPEPLRLETTDIAALVRETVEPYVYAPPKGVSVAVDIAEGLPPVLADERLLKRTFLNLVENALHAINGDGSIAVVVANETTNGARYVEVSVADTGVGIDPELKERIFEPYFSTRAAGTGLGLAIAKKVVDDHGGHIELESEPGHGTTVRMKLPIR